MKLLVEPVLVFALFSLLSACGERTEPHRGPSGGSDAGGVSSDTPDAPDAPDAPDVPDSTDSDSGAGGESGRGNGSQSDCEVDDACDDELACNGRERCERGSCDPDASVGCDAGMQCVEDGSQEGACEFVDAGQWVVFLSDAEKPALFEPYAIRERLVGVEEPIKLGIPLEPGDWTRYTGEADWSFDGEYILFRRGPALLDNPDGLYVVPMGNGLPGEPIELVKGAESAWAEWSPARHQLLAFVDGKHEIAALTEDGVKHYPFMIDCSFHLANWSPDGRRLALLYSRAGSENVMAAIAEVTESGEVWNVLNFAQGDRSLHDIRWSPDGKWVAVIETYGDDRDDVISVVAVDNPSKPLPINTPAREGRMLGTLWSPNGRFLAYQEQRESDSLYDVWVYDTEHPELGSVLIARDLYYAHLFDWLPNSSRLLIQVNESEGYVDQTWFVDPHVPYDYREHQSMQHLTHVSWIDENTAVYRRMWGDSTKLYLASISGGHYLGGQQTLVDSLVPGERLYFNSVVPIGGAPGALLYVKNGELRSLDIRNPRTESFLISNSDGWPTAAGDGGAFFSVPDVEGYDDLYWVDLSGRSPGDPRQVNGAGSVFAYTVQPKTARSIPE